MHNAASPKSGAGRSKTSMTPAKIEAFERSARKSELPDFRVGDTVAVHYKIVEGDKLRVQVFHGVLIKRHRAGMRSTITVRKTSFGVGVERTFPLHSPRLEKIEIEARGIVRKGRLFFLRNLEGKAARLRDQKDR
jgi:large subunit ribosomal protein L19